jgi:hypothetical protein
MLDRGAIPVIEHRQRVSIRTAIGAHHKLSVGTDGEAEGSRAGEELLAQRRDKAPAWKDASSRIRTLGRPISRWHLCEGRRSRERHE